MFEAVLILKGAEYKNGSFYEGVTVDRVRKEYKLENQIKFTSNELEISLKDESEVKLIDLCKDGKCVLLKSTTIEFFQNRRPYLK